MTLNWLDWYPKFQMCGFGLGIKCHCISFSINALLSYHYEPQYDLHKSACIVPEGPMQAQRITAYYHVLDSQGALALTTMGVHLLSF